MRFKHLQSLTSKVARTLASVLLGLWVGPSAAMEALQETASQTAFEQYLREAETRNVPIDDFIWLSTMSDRLQRVIPDPFFRLRLLTTIRQEAHRAGLHPQLVLAVMDVESSFRPNAVSNAGAVGLMQVMPFWKDVFGRPLDDLTHPVINIRYGCAVLRHYIDRFDALDEALAAYNGSRGLEKYPNKVYARYKRNWRYRKNADGVALSLAGNTGPKLAVTDAIGFVGFAGSEVAPKGTLASINEERQEKPPANEPPLGLDAGL